MLTNVYGVSWDDEYYSDSNKVPYIYTVIEEGGGGVIIVIND